MFLLAYYIFIMDFRFRIDSYKVIFVKLEGSPKLFHMPFKQRLTKVPFIFIFKIWVPILSFGTVKESEI